MVYAIILVCLAGLYSGAKSLVAEGGPEAYAGGALLAFGFLLLAAFCAGRIAHWIRLPHVVAYLLMGVAAGPYALDLVGHEVVRTLQVVNGVAVALIALTAGAELSFVQMKPLLRTVTWMTLLAGVGGALVLGAAVLALSPWLPFFRHTHGLGTIALAALLGVALSARSPAVLIAIFGETNADGPVSRTMLGVVVIADLLVIVLYAVLSTIAGSLLSASGGSGLLATAGSLALSLATGLAVGTVLAIWVGRIKNGTGLIVLLLCVAVHEVGGRYGVDTMVAMLAAGLLIRNAAPDRSKSLVSLVEGAALPVYLLFFAVAGATLHLDVLAVLAVPAVVIVATRALTFFIACHAAARLAGADAAIRRWSWTGLLPQAGLALALALAIERSFPELGHDAAALCFAVVAINELVMPLVLRFGLDRSGEVGRRSPAEAAGEGTGDSPAL